MARFGMKSHAGGNRPSRYSHPFATNQIVARFRREGKPDDAWKSRIFNNLERNPGNRPACIAAICRAGRSLRLLPGRAGAIVVLVE
jgi:hypothetical protein